MVSGPALPHALRMQGLSLRSACGLAATPALTRESRGMCDAMLTTRPCLRIDLRSACGLAATPALTRESILRQGRVVSIASHMPLEEGCRMMRSLTGCATLEGPSSWRALRSSKRCRRYTVVDEYVARP